MSVIIETSVGDITVDLYTKERPRCSHNFLKLCKSKYYNLNLFHTIQQNFVAQTGDPSGTGRGGDSIYCQLYGHQARLFEAENKPRIKHAKRGTLSMVNDGNDRHGSQFFITLTEDADYLDKQNHTAFGEVSEGFEILDKLNDAIVDDNNRPLKDIRIYHTVVLDDPFPDPAELVIPASSPTRNAQEKLEPRIGAEEDTEDEESDCEEKNQEREAKTNAQLLELIGDIPDADVKPPDNVLFVCKLNPETADEDLEIIFSRFGAITGCEVIRNKKTNESLQYAFIEFEKAEDCEKAYFKMDNVLIDDRRIHVDFSQSVSKIAWDGRKKEEKETDEPKPQYRVKNFDKQNDGYEFVFEEPESARRPENEGRPREGKSSSRKDKQRDRKTKKRHSSPDDCDGRKDRHKRSRRESSTSSREERHPKKHGNHDAERRPRHHRPRNEPASPKRSRSQEKKSHKHRHRDDEDDLRRRSPRREKEDRTMRR